MHSGESFRVRAKNVCSRAARHDHDFAFPSEGKVPEGRMRCRLRVAEPFTNEKVTLCSVTRCRATPHSSAPPPPSPQRGRLTVGFCFADRDFQTASPEVYAILCSCKERLCQESTLRGFRREVRFIMSPPGKRRHNELNAAPPPETPGERASRERQTTEILCTAEKVSVFGAKTVRQLSARHDSSLASPPRGSCQRQLTDEV